MSTALDGLVSDIELESISISITRRRCQHLGGLARWMSAGWVTGTSITRATLAFGPLVLVLLGSKALIVVAFELEELLEMGLAEDLALQCGVRAD